MPAPYGITDTGFSTKTLAEQLVEIELANEAAFGAGVIQDAQSPLGQLNALYADASAEVWEVAQSLYGSFDVDQATGTRLDALGKLRRITRTVGQTDASYRLAISQSGYGDSKTRMLRAALLQVTGVTFVQIVENSTGLNLDNGLQSHSLAVIVEGGSDVDVATTIWNNTAAGVGLHGNVSTTSTIDGYCRTISFVRPVRIPTNIRVSLSVHVDRCECSPQSIANIVSSFVDVANGDCGFAGGVLLTPAMIEQIIAKNNGIFVESVELARDGATMKFQNVAYGIFEIPDVTVARTTVSYTEYDGPTITQGTLNAGFGAGQIL